LNFEVSYFGVTVVKELKGQKVTRDYTYYHVIIGLVFYDVI